jgi:xanthine dehydrogenase accessory factor
MNAEADAVKIRGEPLGLGELTSARAVAPPSAIARPGVVATPRALVTPRTDWLQPMRTDWPTAVCRRLERSSVVVRVLVAEVLGSAPREAGACMLVTGDAIEGTIGGGNLEWRAIEAARGLLTRDVGQPVARLHRLTLGPDLAQCCGGVVQLWIERFTRADLPMLRRAAVAANAGAPASVVMTLSAAEVTRALVRDGDGCAEAALAASDASTNAPSARASRALVSGRDACTEGEAFPRERGARPLAAFEASTSAPSAGALPGGVRGRASRDGRVRLTSSGDGRVTLIERIDVARTPVFLYGAGHVGQALVRMLAELPLRVTWVDSRADLLPHTLPDNVAALSAPLDAAMSAPSTARHLVMTHDHALDYELCRAILMRNQFAALGLIGSESKAARFRSRLKREGVAPERIARLVCPIGLTDIRSKSPAAIAIGIAAQLLRDNAESESAGEADSRGAPSAVLVDDIGSRGSASREGRSQDASGLDGGWFDATSSDITSLGSASRDATHGDDCSPDHCSSCHRTHR